MNHTTHAETTLFSAEHPYISKHISLFSILVTSCFALLGITCVVLSLNIDKNTSIVSMSLLTVGSVLLLFSLYRYFWKCTETIYNPTGSKIGEGTRYMNQADVQTIRLMMESKNFEQLPASFKEGGNGRMDYMLSKDGKFAAVQLFQFVPYTYEPASEVYYFMDDDAAALARRL